VVEDGISDSNPGAVRVHAAASLVPSLEIEEIGLADLSFSFAFLPPFPSYGDDPVASLGFVRYGIEYGGGSSVRTPKFVPFRISRYPPVFLSVFFAFHGDFPP